MERRILVLTVESARKTLKMDIGIGKVCAGVYSERRNKKGENASGSG